MTLMTVKEASEWLRVHPDRLSKDISAGRINQTVYVRLSSRQTRLIKERLEEAVLEGNLYADQNNVY